MGRVSKNPEMLEKQARRKQMSKLMKGLEIKDMNDINGLFKEMISSVLQNGLEGELDEELGYSKYDYKNRETDNYRNGHNNKIIKTSFGNMDLAIPRDRDGKFEPQLTNQKAANHNFRRYRRKNYFNARQRYDYK